MAGFSFAIRYFLLSSVIILSSAKTFHHDIKTQSGLTSLYNQQVKKVEHVTRPTGSSSGKNIPFVPHEGVVVTTKSNERYLIHKGDGYGKSGGETVVVNARHMGSSWKPVDPNAGPVRVDPTKNPITVSDLVKESGPNYKLLSDNCWDGAERVSERVKNLANQ